MQIDNAESGSHELKHALFWLLEEKVGALSLETL